MSFAGLDTIYEQRALAVRGDRCVVCLHGDLLFHRADADYRCDRLRASALLLAHPWHVRVHLVFHDYSQQDPPTPAARMTGIFVALKSPWPILRSNASTSYCWPSVVAGTVLNLSTSLAADCLASYLTRVQCLS